MNGPTQEIRTVGFVGLGHMGFPMAKRLLAADYTVVGFDISEEARTRLEQAGGRVVASPDEVAGGSEVILLMLPDSAVVTGVVRDEAFAERLRPGTLLVDMSSSEPGRTRELAAELVSRRIRLIDAPVSGGVTGAVEGTLAVMVGGDDEDVARAEPILRHLGRTVRSGSVGAGHAIKALNNLLSATHLWITSEAMLIGERFGLDPEVMLEVFNASSGRSVSTEQKWPRFIVPETYDSGFALRLMLKDVLTATRLAEEVGVEAELGGAAVRVWEEARAALPADADHTEIARYLAGRATAGSRSQSGLSRR